MRYRLSAAALLLVTLVGVLACGSSSQDQQGDGPAISGRIEAGLRVLTIDPAAGDQHFVIYRGDYVRPELATGGAFTIDIPELEVSHAVPAPEGQRAYFKVPNPGKFAFTVGAAGGTIEAVEYTEPHYREVTAKEAAGVIENLDPVILDVRTSGEFAGGHIEGAILIPVQQIQKRVGELADAKERPVLVYCRSGNRSTVAAKVLIDAGFEQVINLRRGVNEWGREGLPLVK